MKFGKDDLETLAGLLEMSDEIKPVVALAIEKGAEFAAELKASIEKFSTFLVDNRISAIRQIEDAGFTKEEAIVITSDIRATLKESLNRTAARSTK